MEEDVLLLESLQALQTALVSAPGFLLEKINDKLPDGHGSRNVTAVISGAIRVIEESVAIEKHLLKVLENYPEE